MSAQRVGGFWGRLVRLLGPLVLLVPGPGAAALPLRGVQHWAAYYGAPVDAQPLQAFDLLVLEPDNGWDLAAVRRPGQTILAYLSVGEVHRTRPYYPSLAGFPGTIVGSNPDWTDAMIVDPRSARWRRTLLQEVVPAILAKGYDGLFLDTLDSACDAEDRFPGATAATVDLLLAIKKRFPQAALVSNGGVPMLPRLAPVLAAIATESIVTDYQFKPPLYRWRDPAGTAKRLGSLQAVARAHGLPVLVIEYVDPADAAMGTEAAERARQLGLVPYVADIGLSAGIVPR
jgi:uncharacterized protein (TIGR01370 family)